MWITHLLSVSPKNGFATYSNHRSAINSFFRDFQKDLPLEFKNALQECYVGLKKDLNQMDATSVLEITTGKEPMREILHLRSHLSRHLLESYVSRWKRRIYSLQRFNHMCWNEDHLQTFFAHSKTDQSGDKPGDPNRLYANPVHPEICPILALGIYLLLLFTR